MNERIVAPKVELPLFAAGSINLASAKLGAAGISSSDEFFAPLARMLSDEPPVFLPVVYDEHGKWMDGWESRRRRGPGNDHAVVRLARPGTISGFDIDTAFFTGNYPPAAAIEAANCQSDDVDEAAWQTILPKVELNPDAHHFMTIGADVDPATVWTHVRLQIYPDGGVARLKVFGAAYFDWNMVAEDDEIDLVSLFHGGRALARSDAHYGAPERMLGPGRGENMGDGWETARRRGPGHDWAIIKLGHRGVIEKAVVDTAHFKGNYPESCTIQGIDLGDVDVSLDQDAVKASQDWLMLMDKVELRADHVHEIGSDHIASGGAVTHVRLNIHPDGGVSRLRLRGRKA